jgi:hypothetical protein
VGFSKTGNSKPNKKARSNINKPLKSSTACALYLLISNLATIIIIKIAISEPVNIIFDTIKEVKI